jgi:hypothetical protein
MSSGYETYQDDGGEWRWRFKDDNNEIIADSAEGYESKDGVNRAIANVIAENLKIEEEDEKE